MTRPMASHTKKRTQVATSRPDIKPTHRITEIIGKTGTKGTRKPRWRFGCDLRRKITPSETSKNAKSVPMLERSAVSPTSRNPAGMPTKAPATHVDQCGVWNFLWSVEKKPGRRPSRDMANQMRVWPYWKTISEEI